MSITAFGEVLRSLRVSAGISQRQLARLAQINSGHLSRIEGGLKNPPKRATIDRFSAALNLDEKKRRELFAAAGYHANHPGSNLTLSSPVRLEPRSETDRLLSNIRRLDYSTRNVFANLVGLMSSSQFSPSELKLLNKNLRLIVKAFHSMAILSKSGEPSDGRE